MTKEDLFLDELKARLKENKVLAENTWLPKPLTGMASYLAFHTFRSLFFVSLMVTVIMFGRFYATLMSISKLVFWYE